MDEDYDFKCEKCGNTTYLSFIPYEVVSLVHALKAYQLRRDIL
jgi:hypothetical protein